MLTFIRKLLPSDRIGWFLLFYSLLYFGAINLVVLNRFWQFEAFYFDHGIYDSSLWQVAHGDWPIIDHLEDGFIRQFGDHFTPAMYFLTPLYWLTSAYEPILILENLFVVGSMYVIFLIAKARIKSGLMIFAIVFAYSLFIGLQTAIIANFHTELPALFTLALALWAIERKKWKLYWIFLLLTLAYKQNFSAIGVGLGIYLVTIREGRNGLTTITLSLLYYFLATRVAIPTLGLRPYGYGVSFPPLLEVITSLFYPWVKMETVIVSLTTFGFLPLVGIGFLPAIFQDFFTRFVFSTPARWGLGLHYNATLAVLLAFGSILGVSALARIKWYKKFLIFHAVLIILAVLYFHRLKYHGPLGLAYNLDFYRHTEQMQFLRDFIRAIPGGKSVMTLNNLAPYLTHTNKVMLLSGDYEKYRPEIIALDIRPGQNPANFWPVQGNYPGVFDKLYSDPNYYLVRVTDFQLLFIIGSPKTPSVSLELKAN